MFSEIKFLFRPFAQIRFIAAGLPTKEPLHQENRKCNFAIYKRPVLLDLNSSDRGYVTLYYKLSLSPTLTSKPNSYKQQGKQSAIKHVFFADSIFPADCPKNASFSKNGKKTLVITALHKNSFSATFFCHPLTD